MRRVIIAIYLASAIITVQNATAGTWTTLDRPGESHTWAYGIDGSNIVGSSRGHGFLYVGSNWIDLDIPSSAYDIDSDNIVGGSSEMGSYLCNITTSTQMLLHMPGSYSTEAYGIDGNNIVGVSTLGAFLYDGSTWTILDMPNVGSETAYGIYGSNIVGCYFAGSTWHGFLYNGSNWTTLDMLGADGTIAYGIDGNNIVGTYYDGSGSHGFLYNGSEWTTLDMPGAFSTFARGIDGDYIVGYYTSSGGTAHGFIYTIPEPSSFLLFGAGFIRLFLKKSPKIKRPRQNF
jgi:hypothetical protein